MARTGKGDRLRIVLAVLVFLLGAALVAYPYVSDYFHKLSQISVVDNQAEAVDNSSSEALHQEMEASLDYNRRLLANRTVVTDPFDPNNQPVSTEEYNARCNIAGDGVMGSLVIPKIGVTVPVYHGTTDDVLQKGGGHLEATSLPVGGESSHAVIAGHNGLPSVRIFDDLHKLQPGDYFVMRVLGEDHAYRVTSTETVLPSETDSLMVQQGKDLMTLITCTPYGVNTHRLLVHAERCPVPDEWYNHDEDASHNVTPGVTQALLPLTLAGVALAVGAVLGRVLWARRRARHAGLDVAMRAGSAAGAAGASVPPTAPGAGTPPVVPGAAAPHANEPPARYGTDALRGKHARPDGGTGRKRGRHE